MKNTEKVLFEKTQEAFDTYKRCKIAVPDANWELYRRVFCALMDVIHAAGLNEEFKKYQKTGEFSNEN